MYFSSLGYALNTNPTRDATFKAQLVGRRARCQEDRNITVKDIAHTTGTNACESCSPAVCIFIEEKREQDTVDIHRIQWPACHARSEEATRTHAQHQRKQAITTASWPPPRLRCSGSNPRPAAPAGCAASEETGCSPPVSTERASRRPEPTPPIEERSTALASTSTCSQ